MTLPAVFWSVCVVVWLCCAYQRAAATLANVKFPFKSNSAVLVHVLGHVKPGARV